MSADDHPRALRRAALAGFILHALAVLWIWRTWEEGLRGSWLVYIDLPVALFYLAATQHNLLVWSLLLGGLQWAIMAALLSLLVGRLSERRRSGT